MIMIDVYIPSLGATYDFRVDETVKITSVVQEISEMLTNKYKSTLNKTAEEFIDLTAKSNTIMISDILNSRGYWTYDKNNKRPYMSIFDICELLQKA